MINKEISDIETKVTEELKIQSELEKIKDGVK
jgi:hypothetical protein